MIHVPRGPSVPWILADPKGPAARERKKAEEFFKKGARDEEKDEFFDFKVYSDPEIKAALERLFHGKCAYCEAKYAGTQPMDVEHWRPKSRVRETDGTTSRGYYWLASEWTNLLPSCIDCNRQRIQITASGDEGSSGKADLFPVANPKKRGTPEEAPLLLDPCAADPDAYPERHLEINELAVAIPRNRSPHGRASIDVYGLNRIGLVDERLHVLRLMQHRFATILGLATLLDRARTARFAAAVEDMLVHEIVELKHLADPRRAFTLMARLFLEGCRKRLEAIEVQP